MNKLKINNSSQINQKTDIIGQTATRPPAPPPPNGRDRQVDKESHLTGAEDQKKKTLQEPVLGSFYLVYHIKLATKNDKAY